MADRAKIIKGLTYCSDVFLRCEDGCPYFKDVEENPYCNELKKDALALLKEQEAVKPKQIIRKQCKKEHEDGSIDYFAEWYCPHCNMLILRGFDNPSIKFCYKCGKPILWESR